MVALLSLLVKGVLGLGPFPKGEMLTIVAGCNMEITATYIWKQHSWLLMCLPLGSRQLRREAKRNLLNSKPATLSIDKGFCFLWLPYWHFQGHLKTNSVYTFQLCMLITLKLFHYSAPNPKIWYLLICTFYLKDLTNNIVYNWC